MKKSEPKDQEKADPWTFYEGKDLSSFYGDIEDKDDWQRHFGNLENLKAYIIQKGYSGVTLKWGCAFFKKVDYLIKRENLERIEDCDTWVYDSSKDPNRIK